MATITSDKILSFLRKRQFEELGSGIYSDVFAAPGSNRVLKICRGNGDDWPHYVLWATKQGYAGSFAPKVFSLKFGSDYYVASMERLMPIKGDDSAAVTARSQWRRYINWQNGFYKPETPDCPNPELHKFMTELRKTFNCYLDLHGGNIMRRADGRLVITDPVTQSEHKEKIPSRMRARDIAWARNAQFQSQKSYAKA